jgi:hypothetical protein
MKKKDIYQEIHESEDAVFVFVGSEAGVAGLPHEISVEEAERLGVYAILVGAIENGLYAQKE